MCVCVILIHIDPIEEGAIFTCGKCRQLAGVRRSKACACDKTTG